ncbi:DUF1573 domain-containing protein [Petrimonas sulfuriphila]|uniref:DUF1573 domain-containing protein n=1 Tax=Petrimonas sulfuriphila TaxID=285070 RepID=UPI003246C7C3
MRLHFFILLLGTYFLLFSCKEDSQKEIAKIVTEWQNKEIIFPEDMVFTRYGQDTIQYGIPGSDYKILLYVDSVGCTGCKLQLHKWSEFIAEVDSLTSGNVPVLFFFHPKDMRELTYLLKRDAITIPVCIDDKDQLNAINRFPSRDDFQCFLLDKDNKVVYIGNPIHNPRIKEMYLSRVAPEAHTVTYPSQNTIVQADQTEFNLGTLKRGNPTKVTALIRNVGEVPFVVYDTKASCGCTSVRYKKEPTVPGSSMEIEITYNAEDSGYFNRTISIYGNMDNSPLIIRLKGNTN